MNDLKNLQAPHNFGVCASACCTKRYARGFTRVAELLTVRVAGTFRLRLISYFGRKNYYLARKGEYLINPAAQQYIISQAEALGLRLDDYFDEYVERYDW